MAWRNLAQDIQHDLRIDAYRTTQELDHQWFESRSTGDLMAALKASIEGDEGERKPAAKAGKKKTGAKKSAGKKKSPRKKAASG